MDLEEIKGLEKINLSNIKIISTTGSPSDTIVICNNKQLSGVKSIKFEMDTALLVGKVTIEAYVKDIMIDAQAIDTTIVETKGLNASIGGIVEEKKPNT